MVLTKSLKKFFTAITIFLAITVSAFAMNIPSLKGRVNDYANIINSNTENELNSYLASLENTTGIQLVVLTIPSLQGDNIASFSNKVAESWGIGRKDKDDGALLVVALQERDVRIEVGYGLEEKLTDTKCGLIIRNVIIPEFKNGNYSAGILKGIKNMGGIATDNTELVSKTVTDNVEEDGDFIGILVILFWIIVFFVVINSKARRYGRRGGFPFWIFFAPPRGGSNFRSSGGFGGFGGGSSFHGGGGHFGGGGASGHW